MKLVLLNTFLIALISCSNKRTQSDFDDFSKKFKQIDFPMIINDSLVFESWNPGSLIDTIYVKEYSLASRHLNKDYSLKSLKDYKCSYVGKYQTGNHIALLYKLFTTEAGSGNPEIVLAVFTKDGEKKDEITVLRDEAEDHLLNQRNTLSISNDSLVEINSIQRSNGYLNGKLVPRKITEKTIVYAIHPDGKILMKKESSDDVFKDDNPQILDELPEE